MKRRSSHRLPIMVADLMLSSWETIVRRSLMIAQGSCSPAEYRRMVREKAQAAYLSGLALAKKRTGSGALIAALAPWQRRAAANARRLRKK